MTPRIQPLSDETRRKMFATHPKAHVVARLAPLVVQGWITAAQFDRATGLCWADYEKKPR